MNNHFHLVAETPQPNWIPGMKWLLGEPDIQADTAEGCVEFQRRAEPRRSESDAPEMLAALREGWRLGASDFLQRLAEKLGRRETISPSLVVNC